MFDGTTFRCPNHNEFDVADSVLKTGALMEAGRYRWEQALYKAAERAPPGKRARIFTYDFDARPPPAAA